MNENVIYWAVTIISLLISVPAAFVMDNSLHKKHPEFKPYKWGYYIGWGGTIGGSTVGILQFIEALNTYGNRSNTFTLLGFIFLAIAAAHFFVIKRSRLAWIIVIVLQLNPILWVINGIYLRNRWTEMDSIPISSVSAKFGNISPINRTLIAGSAFWASVILAFIFVFEPYGDYVSDIEWWQVVKIIIFPPVVVISGYILYIKVIKQDSHESK